MSNIDNGGPAFPGREYYSRNFSMGMTLRDYFAAKALSGIAADHGAFYLFSRRGKTDDQDPGWAAVAAYRVADAMLAERAKGVE